MNSQDEENQLKCDTCGCWMPPVHHCNYGPPPTGKICGKCFHEDVVAGQDFCLDCCIDQNTQH